MGIVRCTEQMTDSNAVSPGSILDLEKLISMLYGERQRIGTHHVSDPCFLTENETLAAWTLPDPISRETSDSMSGR